MSRILLITLAATVAAYSQTRAQAEAILKDAEAQLLKVGNEAQRASWIQSTYITEDTGSLRRRERIRHQCHQETGPRRRPVRQSEPTA